MEERDRRRRRRSHSPGRQHKHRRRHEERPEDRADAETSRPLTGPPAGWHGSSGGVPGPPPPGYPGYPLPPHLGGSPYGASYGPPPGWGPPPGPTVFEVARPPQSSPFGAVPPPPGLDPKGGKGRKGKGGKSKDEEAPRASLGGASGSPGLVLMNVPPEVNTLDALNRHFRQFGQVLKITSFLDQAKAFVQFATREAAEAAAAVAVLGIPDIAMAWAAKPSKGKGKASKGDAGAKLAENRVFLADPEEQRKHDESRMMKDELVSRKAKLLGGLTEQMKMIMGKLNDETLSEAKREAYRTLLLSLKEKLDSLGGLSQKPERSNYPVKGKSKGERVHNGQWTLDLRSRVFKVTLPQATSLESLREELARLGATADEVADIQLEAPPVSGDDTTTAETSTALVWFRDRASAERLFAQRSELAFGIEWLEDGQAAAATVEEHSHEYHAETYDEDDALPASFLAEERAMATAAEEGVEASTNKDESELRETHDEANWAPDFEEEQTESLPVESTEEVPPVTEP